MRVFALEPNEDGDLDINEFWLLVIVNEAISDLREERQLYK